MKSLKLTNGQRILLDNEDYVILSKYKVFMSCGYAEVWKDGKHIRVHRLITNAKKGEIIDHIDQNKLNNQKSNLRVCNKSQNRMNCKPSGKSKYLGVAWNKNANKWQSQIKANGKYKYLGLFEDELKAAKAYNEAAILYHKNFASLNSCVD